jgi:hypothetical protein
MRFGDSEEWVMEPSTKTGPRDQAVVDKAEVHSLERYAAETRVTREFGRFVLAGCAARRRDAPL